MRSKTLMIMALLAVWSLSLVTVYSLTRSKWYDLGQQSGEINGKSQMLATLCKFSTLGDIDAQSDARFDVKATSLTIKRHDEFIEIRCS